MLQRCRKSAKKTESGLQPRIAGRFGNFKARPAVMHRSSLAAWILGGPIMGHSSNSETACFTLRNSQGSCVRPHGVDGEGRPRTGFRTRVKILSSKKKGWCAHTDGFGWAACLYAHQGALAVLRRAIPRAHWFLTNIGSGTLVPSALVVAAARRQLRRRQVRFSRRKPERNRRICLRASIQAQRFLAERGWTSATGWPLAFSQQSSAGQTRMAGIEAATAENRDLAAPGTDGVQTPGFGLVTAAWQHSGPGPFGRDRQPPLPGNKPGGGCGAQNAGTSNASSVVFTPLTDTLAALGGAADASISIGATDGSAGGTRVILAAPAIRTTRSTPTMAAAFCVRPMAEIAGP